MKIHNKLGTVITNLETWETAFLEVDDSKHWKPGRSACCLGKYFDPERKDGEELLRSVLGQIPSLGDIVFGVGIIEFESKFDQYKGRGRFHDLAVWGHDGTKKFFVGIEAKVDETFGDTIAEARAKAEARGSTSNGVARIDGLKEKYLAGVDKETVSELRYQLLFYLAGSVRQAERGGAEIAVMPVIVFHSDLYHEKKGDANKKAYLKFFRTLGFDESTLENGMAMFSKVVCDIQVYSFYIEIDEAKAGA